MHFSDVLNDYIEQIGCSAKKLSDASHVSPAVISRYRNGERIPNVNGTQLVSLASGIEELSRASSGPVLYKDEVLRTFIESITGITVEYSSFLSNLNSLVAELGISNNELARALSFDPSYISRILAGQRHPADMPQFIAVVSRYVARRYSTGSHAAALANMIGFDSAATASEDEFAEAVVKWLGSNIDSPVDSVSEFLHALDTFDLDEYIRTLRFDKMDFAPRELPEPTTRHYAGIEQMMEAELGFIRTAATAPPKSSIVMYSDMPMMETSQDCEFVKKWIYGMAQLMKTGVHLEVIHDVNRPFQELAVGLESWVPLYMTGNISSYYLANPQCDVFHHLLRVSDTVALTGHAISGYYAEGRYMITNEPAELAHYQRLSKALLRRSHALMDIYRRENAHEFAQFINSAKKLPGRRRILLSAPPLATISPGLLARILADNEVPAKDAARITRFAESQRLLLLAIMDSGEVQLETPRIGAEEFRKRPVALSLSGLFYETDVMYTYDSYREHLELTQAFADRDPRCTLRFNGLSAFRNIQILIHEGAFAVISKGNAPTIHFVIHHPNIVSALESFVPPIVE